MWIDKKGHRYSEIPQRWIHEGKTIELACDPRRAKRFGWTEDLASLDENTTTLYSMENLYLESTKALMILAGVAVKEEWPKLEDFEFVSIRRSALEKNTVEAIELLENILYSFNQIIRYGGTWDRIQYHK